MFPEKKSILYPVSARDTNISHRAEGWYWSRTDTGCDVKRVISYEMYFLLNNNILIKSTVLKKMLLSLHLKKNNQLKLRLLFKKKYKKNKRLIEIRLSV